MPDNINLSPAASLNRLPRRQSQSGSEPSHMNLTARTLPTTGKPRSRGQSQIGWKDEVQNFDFDNFEIWKNYQNALSLRKPTHTRVFAAKLNIRAWKTSDFKQIELSHRSQKGDTLHQSSVVVREHHTHHRSPVAGHNTNQSYQTNLAFKQSDSKTKIRFRNLILISLQCTMWWSPAGKRLPVGFPV